MKNHSLRGFFIFFPSVESVEFGTIVETDNTKQFRKTGGNKMSAQEQKGEMQYLPPKHIVSAAAIVQNERGEILLIKGPRRGWEMPGGQVEEGESLKAAAIRETKEETGIDISALQFCGIFQNVESSICNALFRAEPIGGELTTSEESLEVGFFPLDEAMELVTWKNFRQRIRYCLDLNVQPFYIEF